MGTTDMLSTVARQSMLGSSSSRLVLTSSRRSVAVSRSASYATGAASATPPTPVAQSPAHSTPGAAIKANKLQNLGSIEASWVSLPRAEQERIYGDLLELQKKDWKELSLDEKKAAYYIAYGAHGPRAPIVPPNTNGKVFLGVGAAILAAFGVFALVRSQSMGAPRTMNKEWKEAQTEYAKEQKMDPFTGVSRPDGKGKTYA